MDLKTILKEIKLREGTIKSILLSIIFVAIGIYALKTFVAEKGQTIPPLEIGDESKLPAIHTVEKGEDLWNISEKYYGSGYNWIDIASENDLSNPNIIAEGQQLSIPKVSARLVLGASPPPEPQKVVTEVKAAETKNTYKVEEGDNLWKIAEKFYKSGYNWVDIYKANQLKNPAILVEGTELKIPDVKAKELTTTESTTVSLGSIQGDSYQVQKGDCLWSIAVRAYSDGYKWPEIAKKNSLKNPGLIVIDQTLSLPR